MVAIALQIDSTLLTVLGSVASIVALLIGLIARRDWLERQFRRLTGRREEVIKAEAKKEFIGDLFGGTEKVELVENGKEYGRRIDAAAENAVKIRRLSGNLEGQENQDDYEEFCDENIEKQLLVIRPEPPGNPIGNLTGNELIRNLQTSRDSDARTGRLKGMYQRLRSYDAPDGDWENIKIKAYWHTPWIRMAIYEDVHGNREAGFTFSPSVIDFRSAPLFWTKDSDTIAALNSYFDDIWSDERTKCYSEIIEDNDDSENFS